MARSARRRQAGILVIALGVGVLGFAFLGGDDPQRVPDAPDQARSISSEASVLGVVVTPDSAPPTAPAASPATFDGPARRSSATSGAPAPTVTSTTTPSASLIAPTAIENTTTTTERPTPTSIDLSTTTTTEPTTTSTEPPTTEPPAP